MISKAPLQSSSARAKLPYALAAALTLVPVSAFLNYIVHPPAWTIFAVSGAALAILAEWMRRATEQVALHAGPAIGGLLNVSFGSAAELILALFVIARGHEDVVRAQITGSILGTSLLGLGLACLAGGISRDTQCFSRQRAGLQASLFMIVVVALLMPAIFDSVDVKQDVAAGVRAISEQSLSIAVACVLIVLYAGNLIFTLVTHRDMFSVNDSGGPEEGANWSLPLAIGVLVAATALVALCAEWISGALESVASTLHLSMLFLGAVPLALIGTAADLFAAVGFAKSNRMNLSMTICLGSAIQVGLVVAPLLVLLSWAMGGSMNLVFPSGLHLFAIASAAFIAKSIAADGETNWFEGLMLIGVYAVLAVGFFFIGG